MNCGNGGQWNCGVEIVKREIPRIWFSRAEGPGAQWEEEDRPKEGQLGSTDPRTLERFKNEGTNSIEKRIPLGLEIGTLVKVYLEKIDN